MKSPWFKSKLTSNTRIYIVISGFQVLGWKNCFSNKIRHTFPVINIFRFRFIPLSFGVLFNTVIQKNENFPLSTTVFQRLNILGNISRLKKYWRKTCNKNAIYIGLAALLIGNYGSKMLVAITTWNCSISIINLLVSLHMYAYF